MKTDTETPLSMPEDTAPGTRQAGNRIGVRFKYLHPLLEQFPPAYATENSAGLDLRAAMDQDEISIPPGGRYAFGTGLAMEITEPGLAGFVFSRSGLGTKEGLTVSQGVGVIDPDYRGEIIVSLLNTSDEERTVRRGQRIAQLVFMPVAMAAITRAENLGDTARGGGGFGHTGKI